MTKDVPLSAPGAVAEYFERRYPERRGLLPRLFRRNEKDLRRIVRRLVDKEDCRRILDLGCGDGMMLASAIERPIEKIFLVDIAERNVASAREALASSAGRVEGEVADVRTYPISGLRVDLVLMLGVLDYLPDWRQVLARTARATTGTLLVNVPRSDRLWHRLRRLRLALCGIELTTAGRHDIQRALAGSKRDVEIFGDRFSWYVLCRPAGRAKC